MLQVFFYAFSTRPPFGIECVTPVIDLGLSAELEYPMHVERHGDSLYLSVGVDNCWSALVKLRLSDVMQGCRAGDLHRKVGLMMQSDCPAKDILIQTLQQI